MEGITMKKKAFLLVNMFLIFSLLVACGGNNETIGNSTEPSEDKGTEQVTIKLHSWYQFEGDNFDKVIEKFESKYPNINVEFESLSEKSNANEYLKKLDLAAASNDQLDVIIFPDAVNYAQRVNAGMVAPLDEFIAEDGFKYEDEYKFDTKFNGKYYGLPGKYIDWMVLINKNHLDEAGLEVPTEWTWDEFIEYSKALTKGEGPSKRYGSYFQNWGQFFQLAQMNAPTVDNGLVTHDEKPNVDTDRIRKSLEILNQTQNVDQSATSYADVISQKLHYRNMYFGGQASMIVIGNWMIPDTAGGNPQIDVTFPTVFAPYPKFAEGDENGLTIANGDFISVAQKSEHKKEAYTFVRWLSTEGLLESGKFISSWKKADMEKNLQDNVAAGTKPEMANMESLTRVASLSKGTPISGLFSYYNEAQNAYIAEAEKYLLGNQDLETTIKNAKKRVQEVIDANK
jgi:multiple sugar transport system substrate-binding protein